MQDGRTWPSGVPEQFHKGWHSIALKGGFALSAITLLAPNEANSMHVRTAASEEMVRVIVKERRKKLKKKKVYLAPCFIAAGCPVSPLSQLLDELHMDL